jgi:Tfp pilus assembly protein PilZ
MAAVVVRAAGNTITAGIRLDAQNLSEGGLFLRSDLLFEVGEDLIIEIPHPDGTTTQTHGRVAWVTRGEGDPGAAGMGIEFARLSPADRRTLAERLRALGNPESNRVGEDHGRND